MMAYRNPKSFLWMIEQDRQRAQMLRALERAARSGGKDRAGPARGGISSFTGVLRRAAASLSLRPGRSGRTNHVTGGTGV